MPKTYTINNEESGKIGEARKRNHDKQVEKRLHAVQLRGEGKRNAEIAEQLETSSELFSRHYLPTYSVSIILKKCKAYYSGKLTRSIPQFQRYNPGPSIMEMDGPALNEFYISPAGFEPADDYTSFFTYSIGNMVRSAVSSTVSPWAR